MFYNISLINYIILSYCGWDTLLLYKNVNNNTLLTFTENKEELYDINIMIDKNYRYKLDKPHKYIKIYYPWNKTSLMLDNNNNIDKDFYKLILDNPSLNIIFKLKNSKIRIKKLEGDINENYTMNKLVIDKKTNNVLKYECRKQINNNTAVLYIERRVNNYYLAYFCNDGEDWIEERIPHDNFDLNTII